VVDSSSLTKVKDYLVPMDDIGAVLVGLRRILVEVPLGLRELGVAMARELESKGFEVHMSGRNAWGSCDFTVTKDHDAVLHLGHALPPNILRIIRVNMKITKELEAGEVSRWVLGDGSRIILSPAYYNPIEDLVRKASSLARDVGDSLLAYALPYRLYAEEIAKEVGMRVAPAPMTGCFVGYPAGSKVIVVGGGYFYGLTFKLMRPETKVYLLDVFRSRLEDLDQAYRIIVARKLKHLDDARSARSFGVIVSTKPGQARWDLAARVIEKLRNSGREAIIIEADEVSPDLVNNLPVDAVVNTACPRIGFDDLDRFLKPVINPWDVDLVLNGGFKIMLAW